MIARLARWLRSLVRAAWRALPGAWRERALVEAVRAEDDPDAAAALRRLFAVQDGLDLAVSATALRYERGLHPEHRLTDYHRFFIDRIADGQRVLDVGCGLGAVADAIVRARTVEVVAIDDDPRVVGLARARHEHPRLTFRCADARRELPEGRFDVVVLSHVLEHLEHRRAFLHALKARVEPERVLVRVPLFDRAWTVPLRRELGVRWKSDDSHFVELTQDEWRAELESAGLKIEHAEVRWGELWCDARWR